MSVAQPALWATFNASFINISVLPFLRGLPTIPKTLIRTSFHHDSSCSGVIFGIISAGALKRRIK
jgi:hypothetical protein